MSAEARAAPEEATAKMPTPKTPAPSRRRRANVVDPPAEPADEASRAAARRAWTRLSVAPPRWRWSSSRREGERRGRGGGGGARAGRDAPRGKRAPDRSGRRRRRRGHGSLEAASLKRRSRLLRAPRGDRGGLPGADGLGGGPEGVGRGRAARAGGDAAAGSDAEAKLAALEKENKDLRSTLTGTEEACEGMHRELARIKAEYDALASTLSGTLDTSNEEEEEF